MFNIYLTTNSVNGKVYVGQTIRPLLPYLRTDFTRAIKKNEKDRKPGLYNAMRKYGEEAFGIKLLARTPEKAYADKLERFFIKHFNSQCKEKGYNIAAGGGGSFGYTREVSDRERELRRINGRKRRHTQEEKDKISAANKDKPKSEAHRLKLSISKLGKKLGPFTEEHKANMAASRLGKKATPERIENQRKAMLALWAKRKLEVNNGPATSGQPEPE